MSDTPERKAAEAIGAALDPEECLDCETCAFKNVSVAQTGNDSCLGAIERIIAQANAAYYLPMLREWYQYMPERLTLCGDILREISRLEKAKE